MLQFYHKMRGLRESLKIIYNCAICNNAPKFFFPDIKEFNMREINNKEFKDTIKYAIVALIKPLDFILKK